MPKKNQESASGREAAILALLEFRERYGLEIMEEFEKQTGHALPLGALYTTLDRMKRKGFLLPREGELTHERGGNRRRYYQVTGEGMRALGAYRERLLAMGRLIGVMWRTAGGGRLE